MFTRDYRTSNRNLHDLYTAHARRALRIVKETVDTLYSHSRYPDADIASTLWSHVTELIKTDAAWFDAAALEFANPGEELSIDEDGDYTDTTDYPEILRGVPITLDPAQTDLPPGVYTGKLSEVDGKLIFTISFDDIPGFKGIGPETPATPTEGEDVTQVRKLINVLTELEQIFSATYPELSQALGKVANDFDCCREIIRRLP